MRRSKGRLRLHLVGAVLAAGLCAFATFAGTANAQRASQANSGREAPSAKEPSPRWAELTAAQKEALRPLERDWPHFDTQRKQKWVQFAARFGTMSADEKTRIQLRMAEWAQLSPEERGQARLNFQQAKQIPAEARQSHWDAYQTLTAEERKKLALKASAPQAKSAASAARAVAHSGSSAIQAAGLGAPQVKTNRISPLAGGSPRPVTPIVVQAQPGVSTTLMTRTPSPPAHQQAGQLKIAASPDLVNPATLLPQRAPQSAATQALPASAVVPTSDDPPSTP